MPFSALYGAALYVRHWLYDKGWKKTAVFDQGVICVGNLSLGGTGKTPFTIMLAEMLGDRGDVAILSRGYKRKTTGFVLLDADSTPGMVGDEPVLMRQRLKHTCVAVDADRRNGIGILLKQGIRTVILDDAFQHRKVKAGLNILLTDYAHLYPNDSLFPSGSLRDVKRRAAHAEMIVVTKCPDDADTEKLQRTLNPGPGQKLFFTKLHYKDIRPLHGDQRFGVDFLEEKGVVLFTGIARPEYLIEFVRGQCGHCEVLTFPDHHSYSTSDLLRIKELFDNFAASSKLVLTTAKDAVKLHDPSLSAQLIQIPIFVIGIETAFIRGGEQFEREVKAYVEGN